MLTFGPISFFVAYAEIKSISISYQKTSPFRSAHITQVNSDHPHKKTGGSNSTIKAESFPAEHNNQVNADHLDKKQVLFDPPHQNEAIFGPHIKTVSISTAHIKPIQILIPHRNAKSFSACTQKTSRFQPPAQKAGESIATLKLRRFRPNTKIKSISTIPIKTKPIPIPYTKTKSLLVRARKSSLIRPLKQKPSHF